MKVIHGKYFKDLGCEHRASEGNILVGVTEAEVPKLNRPGIPDTPDMPTEVSWNGDLYYFGCRRPTPESLKHAFAQLFEYHFIASLMKLPILEGEVYE